jgi:hypothetical protein
MSEPPKEISTEDLVADVRSGLDSSSLIKKYGVSEKALGKAVGKLVESGVFSQSDLVQLFSKSSMMRSLTWQCPACGKIVPAAYDSCTRCGTPQ